MAPQRRRTPQTSVGLEPGYPSTSQCLPVRYGALRHWRMEIVLGKPARAHGVTLTGNVL